MTSSEAKTRRSAARTRPLGLLTATVTALLTAAPVAGDIGACGQPVQRLDAPRFFRAQKNIDCQRCRECGFVTKTCDLVCDGRPPERTSFPPDCSPLVHDGEVCLRALLYASCDDYAGYVQDEGPAVPTECNFCPPGAAP